MKNRIFRNLSKPKFRIELLFVFLVVTCLLSSCNSKREVKESPVEIGFFVNLGGNISSISVCIK